MMLNFANFLDSLKYMAAGMGGIFVVMLFIYLTIVILSKVFPEKPKDKDE